LTDVEATMRFMTLVKSRDVKPPPLALIAAINTLIEEDARRGRALVLTGGLLPTEHGARVHLRGGKITVTDGPFTESKEVIGGFAILEFPSKEDALQGAVRLFELHRQYWPGWEGEAEVRQMVDAPVDVAYTPHR
ncbi:MAG: YciI family protein, partial [Myxococcota bacterium]